MSDNIYENNNYNNDVNNDNNTDNTPDYSPDEYYQKMYQDKEQSAQEYAKYGETMYGGTNEPEHGTSYSSGYGSQQTDNFAQSNYQSSQTGGYNSPYTSNVYSSSSNQPAKRPKPKKKKEKKPVTRGAVAAVLIVSIICSALLGVGGGYFASNYLGSSSGLTINKSDSSGSSYASSGSTLTTSEIVEKAADSVVEITTEAVVTGSFSQQYIEEGAGSGVIISDDGYIVTNYHVIEDASDITVTLRDDTEYTDVELVGTYETGDIALLKIDPKDTLTAAVFGDSDKLSVGDYAVAIGNPLGQLGGTVTDGIISALDREVTIDDETMNLLQTNAEISPGNSGGGLFDGDGQLIGIVNAKSSSDEAEGLGFAIPINDVVDVLSDLKEYGYVKGQIYLGMSLSDVSSTAQAWMFGTNETGVYVTSVDSGSNAEKAGFSAGDIIQKVNGTEVTSTSGLNDIIDDMSVGDEVSFTVYRNGSTGTLKMELQEYTKSTVTTTSDDSSNSDDNSIWNGFGY